MANTATISVKIADLPQMQALIEGVMRLIELHTPTAGDQWAERRCYSCVAGYDPQTGYLVYAAWPCRTGEVLESIREALDA